jgi:hypothetical protein
MKKANPPQHINRPAAKPPTNSIRIRAAQKLSDNHRKMPVTIKKAPWEKEGRT